MSPGLGLKVGDVDIAALIAIDNDHLEIGEHGTGRIGAMGRGWNQADVAMCFTAAFVIGADGQQASIFPLRSGIGLQRHGGKAGQARQLIGKIVDQGPIAHRLIERCEWMQAPEFRPGDRDHLGRGIQLHGARTERDHRSVERQIAIRQLA